ncbi:MAG: glutamate--cysteine ligase [Pseudomonadales bacterium]
MSSALNQRINELQKSDAHRLLRVVNRGIEKESLRVQSDGNIAQTAHPTAFGSALANPHITTDFSEALLEFITPVCQSVDEVLGWLREIHQFSYAGLNGAGSTAASQETLWAASMPCILPDDTGIAVAQYGSSNVGQMKTAYRLGLGERYGRAMQTIAGVHYNFSFSEEFWAAYQHQCAASGSLQDFKTEQYFHLIRNFRRYSWLLVYLFGASPALCQTFLGHDQHQLSRRGKGTLFSEHGTSLRMGDLGYQSSEQESLYVCYNSLDEYATTLSGALTQAIPSYERIGTHRDGQRIQLSTALLQIENEFYSSVRPKRVTQSGEPPLTALMERGVEYIEVRCLDVNPYLPMGIDAEQIRFIDAFLLFCLLEDSPPIPMEECSAIGVDNKMVVNNGRSSEAQVTLDGQSMAVTAAAKELMSRIEACSGLFDQAKESNRFSAAWRTQYSKVCGELALPSAQVLADLADFDESYFKFAMHKSREHAQSFAENPLSAERQEYFNNCTQQSVEKQAAIEAADTTDFETFLANYYAQ